MIFLMDNYRWWKINKYKYEIVKLKRGRKLYRRLNAPLYRLEHPEKIKEINKKLFSPERRAKKRREYLEKQAIINSIERHEGKHK